MLIFQETFLKQNLSAKIAYGRYSTSYLHQQFYILQPRIVFYKPHCRLHTFEILFRKCYFNSQRDRISQVLYFVIIIIKQVFFLL